MFFFHQRVPTPKKSQEHLGLLDRFGGDLHLHLLDDRPESWLSRWINCRKSQFRSGGWLLHWRIRWGTNICMLQMFRYTYANNTMNIMWKTIFMCARCARVKRWFKHIHIGGFRQSTGLYISIMSNSHCGMDDHPLLIDEYSFFTTQYMGDYCNPWNG